jgi:hypothetical protein
MHACIVRRERTRLRHFHEAHGVSTLCNAESPDQTWSRPLPLSVRRAEKRREEGDVATAHLPVEQVELPHGPRCSDNGPEWTAGWTSPLPLNESAPQTHCLCKEGSSSSSDGPIAAIGIHSRVHIAPIQLLMTDTSAEAPSTRGFRSCWRSSQTAIKLVAWLFQFLSRRTAGHISTSTWKLHFR